MATRKPAARGKTAAKKPTRREQSEQRKSAYAKAQRDMNNYVPPVEPARLRGRPTEYTPELAKEVLDRIAVGYTLRRACRELDINESTVRWWRIDDREGFSALYTRALQLQAEAWADDVVEDVEKEIDYAADGSHVELGHRKAIADNKKWLMGKNHVARYGDKVTQVHEGGDKPIRHITDQMSEQEAAEAYREMLEKDAPR